MAGLCAPLSTLRQYPRGYLRMTRGRCGSLLLHRDGLAPSTPCRSPGALRNTNEHNGFLVLDKLEAGQHAFRIDTDQDLDRLAGVARGVGKVGVQIDEAEELIILVRRRNRGIALQRPETIGTCHQFGWLGLAEVVAQPACGARLSDERNPAEKGQSSNEGINVDGFSQDACSRFQQNAVVLDRELPLQQEAGGLLRWIKLTAV